MNDTLVAGLLFRNYLFAEYHPSSIGIHAATLRLYASRSCHIIELGVAGSGASTWALMQGLVEHTFCTEAVHEVYDDRLFHKHSVAKRLAKGIGVQYKFQRLTDWSKKEFSETDLMFIESSRSPELVFHSDWARRVRRYIILHHTGVSLGTTFEQCTYLRSSSAGPRLQESCVESSSLSRFLIDHPEWQFVRMYGQHGQWLTVLQRCSLELSKPVPPVPQPLYVQNIAACNARTVPDVLATSDPSSSFLVKAMPDVTGIPELDYSSWYSAPKVNMSVQSSLWGHYFESKYSPGEINEHASTLRLYASRSRSIVEFGVRSGFSTWCFLRGLSEAQEASGMPLKVLVGYDISSFSSEAEVWRVAQAHDIRYRFHRSSSLAAVLPEIDLLFIDTIHAYPQVRAELRLHAHHVRKYIILHDTTLTGEVSECGDGPGLSQEHRKVVKPWCDAMVAQLAMIPSHLGLAAALGEPGIGIWPAVEQFLADFSHEWQLVRRYEHNNGLTVLARRSES